MSKAAYVTEIDNLLARKLQDHVDSHCFILGILCLVKQYPDPVTKGLLEYLAQYARSFIAELPSGNKAQDLPTQVMATLLFLDQLKQARGQDDDVTEAIIENLPSVIGDLAKVA